MNNTLCYILTFSLGAAVGSAVSWQILKPRYERIVKEEIESIEEAFSRKKTKKDAEKVDDTPEQKFDISDRKAYAKLTRDYSKMSTSQMNDGEEETKVKSKPYIISPSEFGECDYETVSLKYHSDRILADLRGNIIEDVDETVGSDSLTHFGEYEDDSVFVRNDELKTDYEILLDPSGYSDTED